MGLTSYNLNVRFVQGNTPVLNFTIYNEDGTLFDTTTVTAANWAVAQSWAPGSAILLAKTMLDGISFPALGTCQIPIRATDTVGPPPIVGNYVHQLVLTTNTGNVLTVTGLNDQNGRFVVDPRVAIAT